MIIANQERYGSSYGFPPLRCCRGRAVSRVVGGVDAESLAGTPAVNSRLYHVRRFYYDTAASANPIAMQGLKTLLGGTSHIVFGTDVPYGTSAQIRRALQTVGFSPAELAGIERDNALAILPSYRAR